MFINLGGREATVCPFPPATLEVRDIILNLPEVPSGMKMMADVSGAKI